jgi:hypothetical protein
LRLLAFSSDTGGANPRRQPGMTQPLATASPAIRSDPRLVDLEELQARIHALEQRVFHQNVRIPRHVTQADLQKLQLRMQRLERNLDSELWAARQREHTMLEMLSKPPLKQVARERITQLWRSDIPAASRRVHRATKRCWLELRHGWWPQLVAAWHQSLEKARH